MSVQLCGKYVEGESDYSPPQVKVEPIPSPLETEPSAPEDVSSRYIVHPAMFKYEFTTYGMVTLNMISDHCFLQGAGKKDEDELLNNPDFLEHLLQKLTGLYNVLHLNEQSIDEWNREIIATLDIPYVKTHPIVFDRLVKLIYKK